MNGCNVVVLALPPAARAPIAVDGLSSIFSESGVDTSGLYQLTLVTWKKLLNPAPVQAVLALEIVALNV